MKPALRKAALIAGPALLLLGLSEATLRLGGFEGDAPAGGMHAIVRHIDPRLAHARVVPDRKIFWRLAGNAMFEFQRTPVRTNEAGFRTGRLITGDAAFARPDNLCRVVFLGDMATFGGYVRRELRYSEVFQRMLQAVAPSRRYEIVNLALPGHTSLQALRVFEQVGEHCWPDLVVVCVGANDMRAARDAADKVLERRLWEAQDTVWGRWLRALRVWRLGASLARAARASRRGRRLGYRVSLRDYERNLAALARACKDCDADLIVLPPLGRRRLSDRPRQEWATYRQAAARAAKRKSASYVAAACLTPACRAPNDSLFCDATCPNAQGHAVLAAHLFARCAGMPGMLPTEAVRASLAEAEKLANQDRLPEALAHALMAARAGAPALSEALRIYTRMGAHEDAIRLAMHRPWDVVRSPAACLALSEAYWAAGMPRSAADVAEHAHRLAPRDRSARARLEELRRRMEPATRKPAPQTAAQYLRNVYLSIGRRNYAWAAQDAALGLKHFPNSAALHYWLAEAQRLAGEPKRAYRTARTLVQGHSLHLDACLSAAEALADSGQAEQAISVAQEAAKLAPFSWRAQAVLARVAEKAWDPRVGIPAARRAVALRPDDEGSRQRLHDLVEMHKAWEPKQARGK